MIAFFDMDETLLRVNSATLWVKYQWKNGQISKREFAKSIGYLLGYKLALVDVERLALQAAQKLKGLPESDLEAEIRAWYETEIRHMVEPHMLEILEKHRSQGHEIVLLTASTRYVAQALGRDLNIESLIATRFEVDSGMFTGRLDGGLCWGHAKVRESLKLANERRVSLDDCWFYTDSYTDLPMLEAVGHPVVVNPDPRLQRWATRKRVPIIEHTKQN